MLLREADELSLDSIVSFTDIAEPQEVISASTLREFGSQLSYAANAANEFAQQGPKFVITDTDGHEHYGLITEKPFKSTIRGFSEGFQDLSHLYFYSAEGYQSISANEIASIEFYSQKTKYEKVA